MFKILTAALLALLFSFNVFAQAVAQAPQFSGKEVWVYEKVDRRTGALLDRFSQTVSGVNGDRLMLRVKSEAGTEYEAAFTTEGIPVANPDRTYKTPQPTLRFPLKAGDSWSGSYEALTSTGTTIKGKLDVKVVGYEKVTVPAGEFEAWKLEYSGYFTRTHPNYPGVGSGRVTQTYWYAPSIKRVVLEVYEDYANGAPYSKSQTSLVSYRIDEGTQLAEQAPAECGSDLLCIVRKLRPILGAIMPNLR